MMALFEKGDLLVGSNAKATVFSVERKNDRASTPTYITLISFLSIIIYLLYFSK